VGSEASPSLLILRGLGSAGNEIAGREEGWDRVREKHFGHYTVVFELLKTAGRIPIAVGELSLQVFERVHI
jgi:hypothetical protein